MNNPWVKVLVFSLLFGAIGFLLGRTCCHGGGCGRDRGHCEKSAAWHGEGACDHGGACCTEGGKCDKAECHHTMGGACCKSHGGHMGQGMAHGEGMKACCKGMMHGDSTAMPADSVHAAALHEHH